MPKSKPATRSIISILNTSAMENATFMELASRPTPAALRELERVATDRSPTKCNTVLCGLCGYNYDNYHNYDNYDEYDNYDNNDDNIPRQGLLDHGQHRGELHGSVWWQ